MTDEATPSEVTIYEVGPRDGLQNEPVFVSTEEKAALIRALEDAGLSKIEATSFVHPRWIPALADADRLMGMLDLDGNTTFSALVPNLRGMQRALTHKPRELALFMSASEAHNRKNINKTRAETFVAFEPVVALAQKHNIRLRAYVSTVWGCPYQGVVPIKEVLAVTEKLLEMGVFQISLGDTIGVGDPAQTRRILAELQRNMGLGQIALHMHDTRGTALTNCLVGLDMGITTFDSSIGGLGGCPYAAGASGNLATEDLVYMLDRMGVRTHVSLEKLVLAGMLAQQLVGRKLPGRALAALSADLKTLDHDESTGA
jgi:hydroxymethylglutaryl-CoA lyase